jgi:hypothetical protein
MNRGHLSWGPDSKSGFRRNGLLILLEKMLAAWPRLLYSKVRVWGESNRFNSVCVSSIQLFLSYFGQSPPGL